MKIKEFKKVNVARKTVYRIYRGKHLDDPVDTFGIDYLDTPENLCEMMRLRDKYDDATIHSVDYSKVYNSLTVTAYIK